MQAGLLREADLSTPFKGRIVLRRRLYTTSPHSLESIIFKLTDWIILIAGISLLISVSRSLIDLL
jgi:hypothetical protein